LSPDGVKTSLAITLSTVENTVSDLISAGRRPVRLTLARDLVRMVRSGHPWVYRDALRELPPAPAGSVAELLAPDGRRVVATGIYDPGSPLAFRVCDPNGGPLNEGWAESRLLAALQLRQQAVPPETTGYRLANGEGDGLPGLVIDRYGDTAVIKLDGAGPSGFWNVEAISEFLQEQAGIQHVLERPRARDGEPRIVLGSPPNEPEFIEHGLRFTADIRVGQKTGFFLDQRENRRVIRDASRERTVLNVFAYTGGFSIAAGVGGATEVTSVDIAAPALAVADRHWELNRLDSARHHSIAADAFEFLDESANAKRRWDIVIIDPPSFAPSAKSVDRARSAYTRLIAAAARVTGENGLLAAASCSSHIGPEEFLDLCRAGVSQARRRARVLEINGQPADHPWPLACPELRYLKFVLLQLFS